MSLAWFSASIRATDSPRPRSGYASPRMLADIGLLRGASEKIIDTLDALFSGPTPWMPDFF